MALTDLIIQNVSSHIKLEDDEKEIFISMLKQQHVKRRQLFLHEGEICRVSAFVMTGCMRGFSIDTNGFEHVLNFAGPGWWIADMYSLISQKPGTLNIEALEDTEILTLSKIDQEKLYKQVPAFERFFRIIIENSLVSYQQRLMDSLSLTAEERYRNFSNATPLSSMTCPPNRLQLISALRPSFSAR
ncbi:MAG TPA: Crp/Fnr family transcriptional regulator [Chitinophagaceae bacterium]